MQVLLQSLKEKLEKWKARLSPGYFFVYKPEKMMYNNSTKLMKRKEE